jgi:tRNA pseudouridine55 synthase
MNINGILLINKPLGETSFRQISKLRKILGIRKIGHCGTLDPLAEGLLIVCINKATKIIDMITNHNKKYVALVQLGSSTSTDDREGEVINSSNIAINKSEFINALNNFVGEIQQRPPRYSAIKINGKRAYELARKNKDFKIKKRTVIVNEIKLLDFNEDKQLAKISIHCGKGTYIRSIARDLGEQLGCYAHLSSLIRTKIGHFDLNNDKIIHNFDNFKKDNIINYIIPISESLENYDSVIVKKQSEIKVKYGQILLEDDLIRNIAEGTVDNKINDEYLKLINNDKELLAIIKKDLSYKCVLL